MYSATVTVAATANSVRNLVNAAIAGEIPLTYNGRCFQIILVPTTATVEVRSRTGAAASGNPVVLPTANIAYYITAPVGNQLSIDEVFLGGTGTCGVIVLVM